MKNAVVLILALALSFGCVDGGGETSAAQEEPQEPSANVSRPEPNESGGTENGTAAPAASGSVALEVEFTEIELESGTREIRKPNPECYPDAQKCAMMDQDMHIFEYVGHDYYNLSYGADICILSTDDSENDALYLVEYAIDNQDSVPHTISPELLVKTENEQMGYLVSTPYSKTNCTGFYDGSDLDVELGPSESEDFKAVIVIPKNESPLSAVVYVDGKAG